MVEHTQHTVSFPRRKVVLLLRVSWAHSLVSKYPNAVPCQCFRQDLQSVCPTRCALRWKTANKLFPISLRESTTTLLNPNLILSRPFKVFSPPPFWSSSHLGKNVWESNTWDQYRHILHQRLIDWYIFIYIPLYVSGNSCSQGNSWSPTPDFPMEALSTVLGMQAT